MLRGGARLAILLALALSGGCSRYDAVAPGRFAVGAHYSVAPVAPWSRRERSGVEFWTVDGPLLHQLILIPGRRHGETLFPARGQESARARRLRPKFHPRMTAPEIADFFAASMVQSGAVTYRLTRARPAPFGTLPGFRFDFRYTVSDGVQRSGFAVGAVRDGILMMIVHVGAEPHHAEAYRKRVERLIATARPGPP